MRVVLTILVVLGAVVMTVLHPHDFVLAVACAVLAELLLQVLKTPRGQRKALPEGPTEEAPTE